MASIVRGSRSPVLLTATLTVFLLFLLKFGPVFGQSDPPYVAVVRSPVATTTNPTIIEVYRGDSQTASVTFDKAVLLPGGAATPGYMFTLNSPRVPDEAMTNINSEPATLTLPTTMMEAARTGIYTITVTEGVRSVEWRVLVTNETATIRALEYSTGASMGETVTVMVESSIDLASLRWRRDGVWDPDGSTGSSCWAKRSCGDASALKSVVFECHESSEYNNQVHAIMNVIVRECPENMWSLPGCTNTCEQCINGGVCSDLTGLCLCPPGFSGNNCANIHGRNVFGQNAEYKCDDSGDDHADGCQGAIICYPDPLGCFCPAGYKGLNCTEACETGMFGAYCKQECHCAENSACALDTGVCDNNQCEDGWRGTNCQVVDPCPVGVYGDFCNLPCSCSDGGDACSEVAANCANGCAEPWTGIACDEDNGAGNISLTYVRVNPGQAANVTCTVIRNPLVAESDLVLSPTGTPLTADEDARSYKQTKVVEITLETAIQVTCSVGGNELTETIMLMPYVLPVYADASGILDFSDVTSTSITVSWPPWNDEMDIGDGPIIDYRIQYQEEGTTESFMEEKKGGSLSHQFTALQPDTQYEFIIVLVREGQGGEGAPSYTQRQRTLCQAPEKPVLTTAIAPRSVTFRISEIDTSCSSTTVNLQEWDGTSWLFVRNVFLAETSVAIDGLIPCTHHSYRLSVATNGVEEFSDPVNSITTSEALPSVRSLMVEAEVPGELEVMWDPPDQSNNNCSITSYSVSYHLLSYLACSSVVMEAEVEHSTMNTSHIIRKLKSYAQYSVTVRANGDVNGAENNKTAVTTISNPSDPPTNVLQNGSSTTEFTFYWNPPPCESQNGVITNYSYQLLQCNKTITEGTTESQGVILVNLIPFTEYSFMVASSTSEGSGPASDAFIVTTEEDVPGPPATVTLTDRTETSMTIEWDQPIKQQGVIINYQLQYRPTQKSYDQQFVALEFGPKVEIANSGPHIVYQLTELEPSTVYEIQLNAQTSAGEGEVVSITERTNLFTGLQPPTLPSEIIQDGTSATLTLPAINQQYASVYFIRVRVNIQAKRKRDVDNYKPFSENPDHYIAAEVDKRDEDQMFTVGDGEMYGIYLNAPLREGESYDVFIGTGSQAGEQVVVVWSEAVPLVPPKTQVPGPPATVTLTNRTETSMTIEWDQPINQQGVLIKYQLQYRPIQKLYDQQFVALEVGPKVEIANSGPHIVYQLTELEPSTVYEIQLNAQTYAGEGEVVSITERTNVFTGLVPPFIPSTIHGTETGTAALILPALNQQYASGYYIRIKSELGQDKIKRNVDGVGNYDDNPGHYITAEVQKSEEEQSFTIGDGKEYGIYYNAPLSKDQEYQVFIGTGSKVGQDVSVAWSDPGLITEAKDATNAAFLAPTLTILAVVLFVTIVIGIIVFRWYLRRKKSDPGATAAPSHVYARHIPLTTHGINAEGGAYEVPKKTSSFSALQKTGNCTDSDDYANGGYVEYEISNKERESDSYDDVENGNKPGIKGSEMDREVMDICKVTLDKSDLGNPNIPDRGPLPIIDMSQMGRSLDECYEELPGTAKSKDVVACRVKIKDLPKQLQDKNSVPEDTITDEFMKLPHGQQHPWTVGILKDENQDSGILPYDHSRVKLHKDSSGSDIGYINANYIKVQHPQTFIASQDPNERTAEMFWKMVWFEKVEVIVNLSQPTMSSFQYWPISEGTNKIVGDYTLIWYKSSLEDLDLSIREIKIGKGDKLHEVKLCHFLSWPDDRVPSQTVLFIDFIKKVKDLKTTRSQPLLVHCNNGVGATGTFIALYCLMDDLKDSKKTGLSVSSFVNRMRKDRVNMVENEVQYWFLYDCLVVDLLSPEKTVQEDDINLEKQKDEFKILETCRCFSVQHSSIVGRQSHNAQKNRYSAVLPYDFSRAVLQTPGSLIGNTDYINATVINSCYSKDAFIMTQSPLPSTAEDFWRMVYDYDCAAIVCLNQRDENDETTCLYWPDSGKIQHGNMLVECTNVEDKDKYCSRRRLMVNSKNSKRTVTVDHYQLIEWSPDSDQTDGMIELIGKIKPISEEKKTIVVHCMDGASRCGVFVSVLLEISRIRRSKTGRLFETVHKLTGQNPHVMKSLDDYLLCHQLVKAALVEDESKYQEVK